MPTATKNVPINTIAVIASSSASGSALNIRCEVYQKAVHLPRRSSAKADPLRTKPTKQPTRLPLQLSLRRHDDQPRPASKETKATNRSNKAKPAQICQRHEIQAPAEKEDPGKEQPPRAAINGTEKRENEKRYRMNEMIKDGLVPDIQHAAPFES